MPPWRLRQSARLGDDVVLAQEHAAGRRAEALVERDVDRVEQRGDLGERPPVERLRLPEPRAIEVDRGAAVAGVPDLRDEVVPRGQPAADLALRQLDDERRQRLLDRLEVVERDQLAGVTDGPPDEAVQPLVGLVLVELEVAGRVERDDLAAAPVGVDPERDLLGHGPARHEHGGGLAEQLADLPFQHGDGAALAVHVRLQLVLGQHGELGEQVLDAPNAVALEPAVAPCAEGPPLLVGERVRRGGRARHASVRRSLRPCHGASIARRHSRATVLRDSTMGIVSVDMTQEVADGTRTSAEAGRGHRRGGDGPDAVAGRPRAPAAPRSRRSNELALLATVRPDGRPHLVPVLSFWVDGAFHVLAGEGTRKARNLAADGHCVIAMTSTTLPSFDIIAEGEAQLLDDPDEVRRIVDVLGANNWPLEVRGADIYGPHAPTAGPPPYRIYRIVPSKLFGLPGMQGMDQFEPDELPKSTRFVFER